MRSFIVAVFLTLAVFVQPATAAPVTLGTWAPVSSAVHPFWNGVSWDCPTCGIGFLLADKPDLEFLSGPGESAVPFTFEGADGGFQFLSEITAYQNYDTSGVYAPDFTYAAYLFLGTASPPAFAFIADLPAEVAFFFVTPDNIFSSPNDPRQFALFRSEGVYYLGMEDLPRGDFDYNDHVISFREQPPPQGVPEPASLLLLGLGLAGAARVVRRLR